MADLERPLAVDLFAGAGGMSLGFEQAGFDVVASVDIDPIHCATHEYNFPASQTLCKSAAAITGNEIRELGGIGRREIAVVFGGAPCQGFSLIGKRALDDPRNRLVFHFMRIVLELRPRYWVLENVQGLIVGHARRVVTELLDEFAKNGYLVVSGYRVLNAAEYGVPQDRRRLFLFGASRGETLPKYPSPICVPAERSSSLNTTGLPSGPTVWDAIGDLPEAENYPELLERDWTVGKFKTPSKYAAILRGLKRDPTDFSYRREYEPAILTSSLRATHTPLSRRRFKATPHGDTEPVSRFHKLDPAGICNTLRAGTASDRGAFTSPRPIHPFTPRCITAREAARLHSYPDWFRFHATKWHGFRQIGNSVPPLLARAVASEILRASGERPKVPRTVLRLAHPELLTLNMRKASARYGVPEDTIQKRLRLVEARI